jgi:hypothetical protein
MPITQDQLEGVHLGAGLKSKLIVLKQGQPSIWQRISPPFE